MTADTADIESIALLNEPARRALYQAVADAGRALTREEAATAAGVTRALAAFHLDRLVDGGLLEAEYRRLSGRTGPGAGRPAKLYRRGARDVAVSLPLRRYDVAADLFATAIEGMAGSGPPEALSAAAHRLGEGVGLAARERAGRRPSRRRLRSALQDALAERGYEPFETASGDIRFRNCPFHALVDRHRDLVCGTNVALADGILDGLKDGNLDAKLDPRPGQCCVAITEGPRPSSQS